MLKRITFESKALLFYFLSGFTASCPQGVPECGVSAAPPGQPRRRPVPWGNRRRSGRSRQSGDFPVSLARIPFPLPLGARRPSPSSRGGCGPGRLLAARRGGRAHAGEAPRGRQGGRAPSRQSRRVKPRGCGSGAPCPRFAGPSATPRFSA